MDLSKVDYDALKKELEKRLSAQRYYHSLCVMDEAVRLAERYGADAEKAKLAGLLHDITKNMTDADQLKLFDVNRIELSDLERSSPKLYHAISGAWVIEHELNIDDSDIINAVRYHTTAREGMSALEKILYLADFISADRDYDGVCELRSAAYDDFNEAIAEAMAFTIKELVDKNAQIHPDTVAAWNCEIAAKLRKAGKL